MEDISVYRYTRKHALFTFLALLTVSAVLLLFFHSNSYASPPAIKQNIPFTIVDWPRYMFSDQHQGNNPYETTIGPGNASTLTSSLLYHIHANTASEPVIVNGVIYVGAWDGYEYAINAADGSLKWKQNLGIWVSSTCTARGGPSGAAAVDNGMVFIGSGPYMYALNADTGLLVWQKLLGTSGTLNDHLWGSAAVANGNVYVGVSSLCDNPLTQGELYALNETTGNIDANADIVPSGRLGGGIWSTPTIDAATGTVIVTTGSVPQTKPIPPMTASVVTLDWNTLAVKQFWQVPKAQRIGDADWGSTPTLFPGPSGKTYFGCINKNAIYYVFDEANVSAGPVWQQQLGNPTGTRGGVQGSIASSAYVNGVLFIPTAIATINGTSFPGSIGAFDATSGTQLWRVSTANPFAGSVITANGLLYDTQGHIFEVRDQSNGNVLFSFTTTGLNKTSVTVLNGVVYVADFGGHIYAFTPH